MSGIGEISQYHDSVLVLKQKMLEALEYVYKNKNDILSELVKCVSQKYYSSCDRKSKYTPHYLAVDRDKSE